MGWSESFKRVSQLPFCGTILLAGLRHVVVTRLFPSGQPGETQGPRPVLEPRICRYNGCHPPLGLCSFSSPLHLASLTPDPAPGDLPKCPKASVKSA